jgi:hypothetical protein
MLAAHCKVLVVELPDARQIVGIALAPGDVISGSGALLFMKIEELTNEMMNEARRIQADLNIHVNLREQLLVEHETEYPDS